VTAIPKSTAAATRLLEEYADLQARIALVEEDRTRAIAVANQRADVAAEPMLKRMGAIAAAVESWWPHAAPLIAGGKKSVELGGCTIGTRLSRPKLVHGFESDDKAIGAVPTRWFKQCTRIRYSLDRTGTLKLLQLGGKASQELATAGFRIEQEDKFFVERVQQAATISQ
jgi:hypothetical protein